MVIPVHSPSPKTEGVSAMTQPMTGTDFVSAGMADRSPEFLRRGKPIALLVRDARGAATDISPHNADGSIAYSPFAQDGQLRTDFCAKRKVGGYWVNNTVTPNQGWYNIGAFKDGAGPENKPKVTNDHFMIVQDDFPYDSDLTAESEAFSFIPVDTANPWVQRLRYNRPLSDSSGNSLVEDPGLSNAGWSRLLSGQNPGRQFLIVRERQWNGLPFTTVTGYALARLDNIGNSKMDKKDSEGAALDYLPVPDGRFSAMQDGVYQPILVHTWYGGAGWTALGGVPVFGSVAPVATAGTTGKASLVFAMPTGSDAPFTFTGQKSTDGGVTWSTASPDGATWAAATTVSGGNVTLKFGSLASGATKLEAIATGTNGVTATSQASNSVTVL
jgi:hypothetical protein